MKKLILALALIMASNVQAYPLSEATTKQCQDAAHNLAVINAYEQLCGGSRHFNDNISV